MPPVLPSPGEGPARGGTQLDRLVVASATVRDVDTEARERLAAILEERSGGCVEQVLLHTCHRVELIALAGADTEMADLPDAMQQYAAMAAAERVMLVAGGLDSAVLAEEQILGQVRDAYASALERGQTGPVVNELLRRAIRFGRRVQSFAQPMGDRSLADRAARWVEARVVRASGRPLQALVVGTGEMARSLATQLADLGAIVTVASRSAERADRVIGTLAHPERHAAALISDALAGPLSHDIVVIAIRGGVTRLEGRHLEGRVPLVVDLSSPASVAPEAAARLADRLLDLDRLGVSDGARRLSPEVERRLRIEAQAEARAFAAWLEVRGSGDGIAMLQAHGEEVRRRHLERLRLKSSLDDEQAAAVEAMTAAMFGELLHGPTLRLRYDPDAAARVREVFGIE